MSDHAQVKIIPPLVPLMSIALGWLLDKYVYQWPLPLPYNLQPLVAYVAMSVASILLFSGLYYFVKTRQNPEPHTPTNELYTSGIFRLSRNPIYLGFLIAQLVVAIKFNNGYMLVLIPLVMVLLTQWVIKPEEKYLQQKFGQAYKSYQKKVRRWI